MFHFTIRAARHKDIADIYKICQDVLNVPLSPEKMTKVYVDIIEDTEQIVMLAVHAKRTVGFIHARRVNDLLLGTYSEIINIALKPYYQKRGAGTFLVLGVEQWSRQMVTPYLKCTLKSENAAVTALLKSCGYAENSPGAFEKTIV